MKMAKSIKYVVVSALCALFCAVVGLAFSFTSIFTANADVIVADNITCKGASIRLSEDGKSGIRFRVRIDVTEKEDGDYVSLGGTEYNFEDINKGILVIPTRYIENAELNLDGADTGYTYNDKTVKAANPDDLVWSKGSEINDNGETSYYYESSAYVYNIPEKHYENDFSWRGYCTAGGVTYYSDVDTRAVSTVAILEKYEDDNKTEPTYVEGDPLTQILNGFLPMRTTVTSNFVNRDTYLYRVGNANEIKVSSLFDISNVIDDIPINATLTCEKIEGTVKMVDGTQNTDEDNEIDEFTFTDKNATINFNGTGVVKLTVSEQYSRHVDELLLEVVDAKNITTAASATANNVVLLNDVSGTFTVSNGYTFYGNGFTVKLPTTSVQNVGNGFTGYISVGASQDDGNANGGHLDNVRIEGPVYPEMYIYRDQAKITDSSDPDYGDGYNMRYFKNSVIVYGGNCTISNCYISGSRTALCLRGGNNVLVENTTLAGGAYANMQICAGSNVALRN